MPSRRRVPLPFAGAPRRSSTRAATGGLVLAAVLAGLGVAAPTVDARAVITATSTSVDFGRVREPAAMRSGLD